jgi:hypothetical protein
MKNDLPVDTENNALRLSAGLLIAFALAFFAYYSINTISDPVFAIDFSPYYVAGQLLANGNAQELIPNLLKACLQPFPNHF